MVILPIPARSEITELKAASRIGVVSLNTENAKETLKISENMLSNFTASPRRFF